MRINNFGFSIIILITFFIGNLTVSLYSNWGILKNDFFNFRLIELLRLFVMLFLGYYVAYWVSLKSNKIQKRKDLCLKLIDEGNSILSTQKNLTLGFIDNSDKDEGKIVLSGFRRLSNKLYTIEKLCKEINNNVSTDYLNREFINLKTQFGDNFITGFNSVNRNNIAKDFDKFEKHFDDLRISIML